MYANTKGIGMKTDEELAELASLGVGIAYMGLESGDDKVLADIRKGATADKMIRRGRRVKQAGIQLSVTVLVGLAGKEHSLVHATETGRVLSEIDPGYVGALSPMLIPGTELHADHEAGGFQLPDPMEMLAELGQMIASTHLTYGLFHANHASNYLPVRARLPRDKEKTLDQVVRALSGKIRLKPEFMRVL